LTSMKSKSFFHLNVLSISLLYLLVNRSILHITFCIQAEEGTTLAKMVLRNHQKMLFSGF